MSRRSILLATTVCVAMAASATIDQASAHAGGGDFHFDGASRMVRMPSLPANPVEHVAPVAHMKAVPNEISEFTHHKIFKAGNGVTPTDPPNIPLSHLVHVTKPAIPPAVNLPPQVATQSVPPVTPPATSPGGPAPTATPPGNPVGNGVPAGPIKIGTITSKPGINPQGIGLKVIEGPTPLPSQPPSAPGSTPATPSKPPPASSQTSTTPSQSPSVPGPTPATPSQTAPMHPPMHPMPGVLTGGVVIAGVEGDLTDAGAGCYWIKRKFLTPDGEVIGRVKVCEVIDADQP